jgi:uncharacterized damage-inducible protein DinB
MARTDDIPEAFDERSILVQMLHYAQDTAVMKVSGLTEELARTSPLSASPLMSPANILNHLRWVERSWVNHDLLGGEDDAPWSDEDPDAEWREGSELPVADVIDLYRAEAARTRALFSEIDLDRVRAGHRVRQPVTARWILQHLIEETARHNGHLDVVRELLDGSTGD